MSDQDLERARLKKSFLNTLDLMERLGAPRALLLDVVESVVSDIRAAGTPPTTVRETVHSYIESVPGPVASDDPLVAEITRNTKETVERIDVILRDAARKYDVFVAISACCSELGVMLRAVKERGVGGEQAVKAALDGLAKLVATGEDQISKAFYVRPKH